MTEKDEDMGTGTSKPLTAPELKAVLAKLGVPEGEKLAVAVSGGPDSLCLALLAAEIADIVCLTVDHGLREESDKEAAWVGELLASHKIPSENLIWEAEKPSSNIQAEAREARYQLMGDWCIKHGIRYLLTAHHQDDQAETLLLRLARGSGVYGLAAMAPVNQLQFRSKYVSLIRPFLAFPKERLKQTLVDRDVTWIEDPSNKSEQYDRVRVRQFLANPPLEGFSAERLAATAARLRRTRDALEFYEQEWLEETVEQHEDGSVLLDVSKLETSPEEIVLRGLSTILRFVSGERYVPRAEKLERLIEALKSPAFEGYTLYGVQVAPAACGKILFFRELRAAEARIALKQGGCWDNRFDISLSDDIAGLEIGPLGQEGWNQAVHIWPELRHMTMPHAARLVLPAVFEDSTIIAIPSLNVASDSEIGISLSLKTHGWPKK